MIFFTFHEKVSSSHYNKIIVPFTTSYSSLWNHKTRGLKMLSVVSNFQSCFFFFFSFALKFYLFGFLILIPNTDCLFSCQDNYFSSFICSLLQIQWNCFKFFICKTSWQTTLQRKLFLLQRFSALSHLWVHAQSLAQSPSIHDDRKNRSLDQTDLSRQSNVSAFEYAF